MNEMFCPWPQFTYSLIAVYDFFPDRLFKAGARAKVFASRSDAGNWRPFQSSLRDETRQSPDPGVETPG